MVSGSCHCGVTLCYAQTLRKQFALYAIYIQKTFLCCIEVYTISTCGYPTGSAWSVRAISTAVHSSWCVLYGEHRVPSVSVWFRSSLIPRPSSTYVQL